MNGKRLVLIGFRGAGKSTIARALAKRLNRRVLATDALIEAHTGKPVREFVADNGWPAFREVERRVIRQLPDDAGVIIDCGGGVVESPENMRSLRQRSVVVWVDCDVAHIYQRLQLAGDRPLLTGNNLHDDIEKNYHSRLPLYEKYSHFRVDTTRHTTEEVVEDILTRLSAPSAP